METIVRTDLNGNPVTFTLSREKGFFTYHIWVYRNSRPYLHIMPDYENGCKVLKNVPGHGYLSMGTLCQDFEKITLDELTRIY